MQGGAAVGPGPSLPIPSALVGKRQSPPPLRRCPRRRPGPHQLPVFHPVLRDPDSNPYSVLEGKGELPDADLSEGAGGRNRKRSRRRRNDQEPSLMDAATESDSQAGPSENGLGEERGSYTNTLWWINSG